MPLRLVEAFVRLFGGTSFMGGMELFGALPNIWMARSGDGVPDTH